MDTLQLPQAFEEEMRRVPGLDYEAFFESFSGQEKKALRLNPLKTGPEDFEKSVPFHLTPVPWLAGAYYYDQDDRPARHPSYAAGLYYLQEPSAMTPASRLAIRPGDRVLDLCAAPGGKATALGAALRGQGLLLANDINRSRARALVRNMELFGIANACVSCEAPYRLSERLPGFFDKVMLDAPCSGEGMFRKNPAAARAWMEKGPDYFSALQKDLILHAADLLRPGGQMFYSTCTFSPLENEGVISHLLTLRPEMEVIPMEDYEGFAEGLTRYDGKTFHESCRLCRRIWPHLMEGEGHFLCLLQKAGGARESSGEIRDLQSACGQGAFKTASARKSGKGEDWWRKIRGCGREEKALLEAFFADVDWHPDPDRILIRKGKVFCLSGIGPEALGISYLRDGLFLGELKKKRFEPSQSLALHLDRDQYPLSLDVAGDDRRAEAFLKGESLPMLSGASGPEVINGRYHLFCAGGSPLGWVKAAGGMLKNKYPAGWRWG